MSCIVIGVGPGMGRAIAAALGGEHGPVGLIARSQDRLTDMADGLGQLGIEARAYPADITDDSALLAALARARRELGPPSVVVFNASLFVAGPPTRTSVPEFRTGLATGLTAALVSLQAVADDLRAAAPQATLLFTGGGLAFEPWPDGIGLAVQKAGLRHLALASAQELRPQGVSVSIVTIRGTIAPGTAFDPDRIAGVYADLATPGTERPVEVMFTADGPDWTLRDGAVAD